MGLPLQPADSATMQLNLQSDVAEQQIIEGDLAPATYALGFACGELIYLNGVKEETTLVFTSAEKRRPINWRELFGI